MYVLSTRLLTDIVGIFTCAKTPVKQTTTIPRQLPDLWRVSLTRTLVNCPRWHASGWAVPTFSSGPEPTRRCFPVIRNPLVQDERVRYMNPPLTWEGLRPIRAYLHLQSFCMQLKTLFQICFWSEIVMMVRFDFRRRIASGLSHNSRKHSTGVWHVIPRSKKSLRWVSGKKCDFG